MTEEQQHYYDALVRRVGLLHSTLTNRLVQPAPMAVVTVMASLVLRTAAAYCSETLRDQLWSWMSGRQREDNGLCAFCGRPKLSEMPMCKTCWDECDEMAMDADSPVSPDAAPMAEQDFRAEGK